MADSPLFFFALFGAGALAGFVDSIAGGGGLISLPALLATGMPPIQALATNKLQSSFGSFTASLNYVRHQGLLLKDMRTGILFTFFGAATGTTLVQFMEASFLKGIIPVLLIVTAVFFLLQPRLMALGKKQLLPTHVFQVVAGLALGFYDGFFGPGTGSFWMLALVALQAKDLLAATARTKIYNFTSNITALTFFLITGAPNWLAGFCMAMGQVLGARLGSSLALAWGPKLIRPLLILISLGITLNLIYPKIR
ncbi:MAG: TSUP family transporter [Bdellovibrionales bacterium]|nr:TSUP family transporter [Bdellovibrionales bacterium]